MIKLIHFQEYNSSLLPITTQGIPSMHICIDFLPELISQPQIEKQIFGIKLAAYLIELYPMPKSLAVARQIINHLRNARMYTDNTPFLPVLPCLIQICSAFPNLTEEVTDLLLELQTVASTNLRTLTKISQLELEVRKTFASIVKKVIIKVINYIIINY